MKYKFWDTENNTWFKPVFEAHKGKLEELLVTQSGELCLRKVLNNEPRFIHESMMPDRFVKCQYTGARDIDGKKLFYNDIVKDSAGKIHIVEFALHDEKSGNARVPGPLIPKNCELAGNIFEQAHLLSPEQKQYLEDKKKKNGN